MKPIIDQLTQEELRVECAESMGWRTSECTVCGAPGYVAYDPNGQSFWDEASCMKSASLLRVIPNYPTDANAALTLADALAEKGWRWRAATEDTHSETLFQFVNDEFAFESTGPTFQLALCRAYLAVIRATQPPNEH